MSPISSRKMLPPEAASKRPLRWRSAPVKAPFSWPKSSLSKSDSFKAAQFTFIKGPSRRGERRWMALAASSLPVPLSPRITTGAWEAEADSKS
jgi:hypothetical protein